MTETEIGFDECIKILKKNPTLSFKEVKAKVEAKGGKLYPIMYGRAKGLLGLVPSKRVGTKYIRARAQALDKNGQPQPAKRRKPSARKDMTREAEIKRAIPEEGSLADAVQQIVHRNEELSRQLEQIREVLAG